MVDNSPSIKVQQSTAGVHDSNYTEHNSQSLQIRHSSNTFGHRFFPLLQLKNGMLYRQT